VSAPHADLLRDLRELPFHAHVIKYDPARSVGGGYDDGSWTSMSDIGQPFDGERLTIERYAAVEQAHLDVLRAMARESGIDRLRRAERRLILAIDPALRGGPHRASRGDRRLAVARP
jgi:hypothetical protein